jgi:hypothetical protein
MPGAFLWMIASGIATFAALSALEARKALAKTGG